MRVWFTIDSLWRRMGINLRITKYELKYALDLDWFLGLTISHVTLSCSQFLYEKYNLYTIFISFRYVKQEAHRP